MARVSKSKSVKATKEEAEKIVSSIMQGAGFSYGQYPDDGTMIWFKKNLMGTCQYCVYVDVIGGYLTVEAWDNYCVNGNREDALTFFVLGLDPMRSKMKKLMEQIYNAIN